VILDFAAERKLFLGRARDGNDQLDGRVLTAIMVGCVHEQ
jgi:hypothetical protein